MPQETPSVDIDMSKELALMLATVYAESNDEKELYFPFDRVSIPVLGAGEVVEVYVRRVHKVTRPKPRIVVTTMPEPVYI